MNAATLRNILGNADVAAADLATALGKAQAVLKLTENRIEASSRFVMESAIRDLESATFRSKVVRERMQHELALLELAQRN